MSKKLFVLAFASAAIVFFANHARSQEAPYRLARTLEHDGRGKVKWLAWTPDGTKLLSATHESVNVRDASSWRVERYRSVSVPDEYIEGVATAPDNEHYVLAIHRSGETSTLCIVSISSPWSEITDKKDLGEETSPGKMHWLKGGGLAAPLDGIAKIWSTPTFSSFYIPETLAPRDISEGVSSILSNDKEYYRGYGSRIYVGGGTGGPAGFIAIYSYNLIYPKLERIIETPTGVLDLIKSPFHADGVLAHVFMPGRRYGNIIEVEDDGVRSVVRMLWDASATAQGVYALASRADGAALFVIEDGTLLTLEGPGRASVLYQPPLDRERNAYDVVIAPHPTNPAIIAYAPGDGRIFILDR